MNNMCQICKKDKKVKNLSKTGCCDIYNVSSTSTTHQIGWFFKGVWGLSPQTSKCCLYQLPLAVFAKVLHVYRQWNVVKLLRSVENSWNVLAGSRKQVTTLYIANECRRLRMIYKLLLLCYKIQYVRPPSKTLKIAQFFKGVWRFCGK